MDLHPYGPQEYYEIHNPLYEFQCKYSEKQIKVFNRMVGKTALSKYNSKNTKELVIDCDVAVPSWFHMVVNVSINQFTIGEKYPRDDICNIAATYSKKKFTGQFKIMLNPGKEEILDLGNAYTSNTIILACLGYSKIRIVNAVFMQTLVLDGNIDIEIDNCLRLEYLYSIRDYPTVHFIGDTTRLMKRVYGSFSAVEGLNFKKIDTWFITTILKNNPKIKAKIGIRQLHLEGDPIYKSLLDHKIIEIHSKEEVIDLSMFEIQTLDELYIFGSFGSNLIILPKIGKIKYLTIDCCKIKDTDFSRVESIDKIRTKHSYRQVIEDGVVLGYTTRQTTGNQMLDTISGIFDSIIHYCDIELDGENYKPINYSGLLTQDAYIDYTNYQPRQVKSAANV